MASIDTPPQIVPKGLPPTKNGPGSNGSAGKSPRDSNDDERRARLRRAAPHDDLSEEDFHFLISELRDENSRSRMREAVWISIIVHLIILFIMKESPRIWPKSAVTLVTPAEQINNQQLTYLDQKPDTQRAPKVQSNKLSDKDRIAMARNPKLKKLLDDLADNRKTGAPKQQAPQQQAQAMPQGAPQQAPPEQQPQQQQQQQVIPQQQPRTQPAQQKPNPFANYGGSASSSIQNAARAAAAGHGSGGDYGNGFADPNTNNQGSIDILSDTEGVDFAPYMQRLRQEIVTNMDATMPEVARWPLFKQGRVIIEFAIGRDGKVQGMRLVGPSGDVSLDRAAWGSITMSNPLPPLPKEYKGDVLVIRGRFYYNPPHGSELR